ncbi:hypothetical protein HPB48_020096 [Haemaphysalis longicornis]|uniref:Uncharacterized protein n=1 Tax=Haemaphysalis longicornis TaxID=44386 RepID=A0A9J6GD88_HAELO|nr:hypothetical protein HPB48_020096 [Haemaphysalis longicornis]
MSRAARAGFFITTLRILNDYTTITGTQHSVLGPAEPWGLPLHFKLLPEYLKDLGYQTHLVGKVRPCR